MDQDGLDRLALDLGVDVSTLDPARVGLLASDIELRITHRMGPISGLDPNMVEYVVRKVLVKMLRGGVSDGATAVEVRADDGAVVRRYPDGVDPSLITDDLWGLLGWDEGGRDAWSIRPSYTSGAVPGWVVW